MAQLWRVASNFFKLVKQNNVLPRYYCRSTYIFLYLQEFSD